jgi:hypothetical protein
MDDASPAIDAGSDATDYLQASNSGVPKEPKLRFGLRELLGFVTAVGVILGIAGSSRDGLFLAVQAIGLASVGILCLRAENRLLLGKFDRGYLLCASGVAAIQATNGYVFGYFGANLGALVLNLALMAAAVVAILLGLFVNCFWLVTKTYFRPGAAFRGWTWAASIIALIPYTFFAASTRGHVDRAGIVTVKPLVDACDELILDKTFRTTPDYFLVPYQACPPAIRRMGPCRVVVELDGVRIERGGGFFHYGYLYSVDLRSGTYELSWYAENTEGGLIDTGRRPNRPPIE